MISDDEKARRRAKYQAALNAISDDARTENGDDVRRADLAAMVELGLGHPLNDATFNALADLQKELQDDLPYGGFADPMVEDVFRRIHTLLGPEQFEEIFGNTFQEIMIGRAHLLKFGSS